MEKQPQETIQLTFYWVSKALISFMIIYIAYKFAQRIAELIINEVKKHVSEQKKLIIRQLSEIIYYVVVALGVFIALINMGVQTNTIITLLGTLMVTIGFALQNTLSNIFAGIYVAFSQNFQMGDVIRVYLPSVRHIVEGKVVDLNIAYVKLEDVETKKIIYLPNISVSNNVIVNLSRVHKE